jgi:hypothetical protein
MNITLSMKQFLDLEELVSTLREQLNKHRYAGRIVTDKHGIVEWEYHDITLSLPSEG